ncbi:anthocyanidin 3-O-glucosyltransferase 7-like [Senna tora]|uniref:Glycosyltransferase n=1 Tax=Senna tora TaxID=362788 RepID=A0A835CL37_9FABA|nr:anthocyanidin 3-O-glucosyltransferase 7-like [Senna tora]
MSISSENKHIAIVVFPFGSHPLSLLHLSIKLAHAAPNVTFSFINTAKSNQTLFSTPNINIPHNIKSYDVSDGIPEGHVLGDHPFEKLNLFLHAGHENLQKGIDLAVKNTHKNVTCIIADAFVTPSLVLAQNLNIPWIAVWAPLSISLSVHFYTHLIRQKKCPTSLDFIPGLSHIKIQDIPEEVLLNHSEEEQLFSKELAYMAKVLPQAKAVVMSSFEELDPPLFVQDMKSKLKTLLFIGRLTISIASSSPPCDTNTLKPDECMLWLEKQKAKSVAYISFGTMVTPPHHELLEVSEAFEACKFPFLWSLRDDLKALLPKGFIERTSMRGKIVPWAPQTQVLGHGAVGVFVTHCGGNSVVEGISNGVPLICRPFFGDHGMSARMVEDVWGIGVRIEGGVFTKNGLLKSLNLVLEEEEGKRTRNNAFKLKNAVKFAAGPQDFHWVIVVNDGVQVFMKFN